MNLLTTGRQSVTAMSPWPFLMSLSVGILMFSLGSWMNNGVFKGSGFSGVLLGLVSIVAIMAVWLRDVRRESTILGLDVNDVARNGFIAFMIFVFSELMLFGGVFWAHFHSALAPSLDIGGLWPCSLVHSPYQLNIFDLPALNTLILLNSACFAVVAHLAMQGSDLITARLCLAIAVLLGFLFSCMQYLEYKELSFAISDGVFGSVFYILTGLHGSHVIVGTIGLLITFILLPSLGIYSNVAESSMTYWHFVDAIWLIVLATIYAMSF